MFVQAEAELAESGGVSGRLRAWARLHLERRWWRGRAQAGLCTGTADSAAGSFHSL